MHRVIDAVNNKSKLLGKIGYSAHKKTKKAQLSGFFGKHDIRSRETGL